LRDDASLFISELRSGIEPERFDTKIFGGGQRISITVYSENDEGSCARMQRVLLLLDWHCADEIIRELHDRFQNLTGQSLPEPPDRFSEISEVARNMSRMIDSSLAGFVSRLKTWRWSGTF
jgi:hypothetical protein